MFAISGLLLLTAAAALLILSQVIRTHGIQTVDRVSTSPADGEYVQAYDTQLAVVRSGSRSAPAVVFVPGTAAWSEMWRRYMAVAVDMRYQAIAIDLPPFGYSIPPASGDYRKDVQGKRLLGAFDSLKLDQVVVVVHSIGSAPVMEAVLSEPKRFSKLILVSPALGLDSPQTDGRESSLQRWLRKRWLGDTLSACCLTNLSTTGVLVKHFVAEKDKITDPWVELFRRGFRLQGTARNVASWIPELVAPRAHLPSDEYASYQHIALPVDIIWGLQDEITPLAQGEHLHALIPGSMLTTLPGGHVPMIEEPELFQAALKTALMPKPQ